jgi:PQQ-dependent dehydrogenase (methanol/ethanol family)
MLTIMVGITIGWAIAVAGQARRTEGGTSQGTENWAMYGMDPGETRFSPLKEIDVGNVDRLALAWSTDVPAALGGPAAGNQEATLLASNGVLYGTTTWNVVFAVDARTGKVLWKWDPEVNRLAIQSRICCGVMSRGVALYQGKIITPVIDGRLVALDATTGRPVWEARLAYPQDQYTLTMAPRIVKDKVVVGVSGGERPVRGFVDAFDANTGQHAWRFYTVPGNPEKPFESEQLKKASATWGGEWWKLGAGGTVWDGMAYDPQADLLYFGTGNGGPWPEELRGSKGKDNLYICSIIAVKPDTGAFKWYYQAVPGDSWDLDAVQQLTLADLNIGGRQRRVIMQASKGGFFYVLDRLTGEFISAEPYAQLNWAAGVDKKTGRPLINPAALYGATPVTIYPGSGGAHTVSPTSFNPDTGLFYIPTTLGSSRTYTVTPNFVYREGSNNFGVARGGDTPIVPPIIGPPADQRGGFLIAWDPVAQKEKWRAEGGGASGGGTVTTAGNLVFQVVGDGRLAIFRADNGERLRDIPTGLKGGMGPPITFMVDGKQYVALMGGRGSLVGGPGGRGGGGGAGGGGAPPANVNQAGPDAAVAVEEPRVMTFVLDGTN